MMLNNHFKIIFLLSLFLLSYSFKPNNLFHNSNSIFSNKCNSLHAVGRKYSDIVTFLKNDAPKKVPLPDISLINVDDQLLIENIVKLSDSRKANDIVVFQMNGMSDMTDYIVLMDGNSKPQNQAILTLIEVIRYYFKQMYVLVIIISTYRMKYKRSLVRKVN